MLSFYLLLKVGTAVAFFMYRGRCQYVFDSQVSVGSLANGGFHAAGEDERCTE